MKKRRQRQTAEDRRQRFAEEYVLDLNATQAAIRAGYSAHTAKQAGSRLLSHVDVQARVERLQTERTRRLGITVERTQQEIARIAYGDRRKLFDENGRPKLPHLLTEDEGALLAGMEIEEEAIYAGKGEEREQVGVLRKVKSKSWDKVRALEQCMSLLGMHKTRTPAQTEDNVLQLSIRLSGK